MAMDSLLLYFVSNDSFDRTVEKNLPKSHLNTRMQFLLVTHQVDRISDQFCKKLILVPIDTASHTLDATTKSFVAIVLHSLLTVLVIPRNEQTYLLSLSLIVFLEEKTESQNY